MWSQTALRNKVIDRDKNVSLPGKDWPSRGFCLKPLEPRSDTGRSLCTSHQRTSPGSRGWMRKDFIGYIR